MWYIVKNLLNISMYFDVILLQTRKTIKITSFSFFETETSLSEKN